MKKIALIGTQGIPARYGGFETLVENLVSKKQSEELQYTVFCSSVDLNTHGDHCNGARLKYIPLKANGISSTFYDILSMIKAINGYDAIVVLGVSGGIFFPVFKLLCRKKLIVNIDGLEWKRNKWKGVAKFFLRVCEEFALRFSDVVIADNQGIVNYIRKRYKKKTVLIAYGSDHVKRELSEQEQQGILNRYEVKSQSYYISICRIEPENNCELILDVFTRTGKPLIFIGNWDNSEYGRNLKGKYSMWQNIRLLNAIYDLEILYTLRSHSKGYIHGHSAGGTNPSLVEAMFCKCNVVAFNVVYNRETTANEATYFTDGIDLALITSRENDVASNSQAMYELAMEQYTWKIIAQKYELLYS